MKLCVKKETISDCLKTAAGVCAAGSLLEFCRSVWLEASAGKLSIMATDGYAEMTGAYGADVSEAGMVGVPCQTLDNLIKNLPSGEIELSAPDGARHLRLKHGRSVYHLPLANKECFQSFAPLPAGASCEWNGIHFAGCLRDIEYCIGDGNSYDATDCICFARGKQCRIDAYGLDGHQFALRSFDLKGMADVIPDKGLLINRKYLARIRRWLRPGYLELRVDDKRLYLCRDEGSEVFSVPREMLNPIDYYVFIDKLQAPDTFILTMNRNDACVALRRLSTFNTKSDRAMGMTFGKDEVSLSVNGGALGFAKETLGASYAGKLDGISFPTLKLLEIFEHFSSVNVEMTMTGKEGPCGIRGSEDHDYLVILMPMTQPVESRYAED